MEILTGVFEDPDGNQLLPRTDVLDTEEEIKANTESGKAAGAQVVKQVISDLTKVSTNAGGMILTKTGSGSSTKYYIQAGADAASKKQLGSYDKMRIYAYLNTQGGIYIPTNGRQIKITLAGSSPTERAGLVLYGMDAVDSPSANRTKLPYDASNTMYTIPDTTSYKYVMLTYLSGSSELFDVLVEWS